MSIFDERLRRLKHAGQMAVTQQDRAFTPGTFPSSPAATALPVRGPFLPTVPPAAPPVRSGGPRRVQARLIALPAAPQPTSRQPAFPQAAPTLPPAAPPERSRAAAAPVAGPALQPESVAPRDLPGQQPGQRPLWTPAAGEVPASDRHREAGPSGEPDLRGDSNPYGDSDSHGENASYGDSDPYGDYAEALAAGLSSTPPLGLLPPAPERTAAPAPERPGAAADAGRSGPLRPASFLETLALNTRPDDRDAVQPPAGAAAPDPATPADLPSAQEPELPAAAALAQVTRTPEGQPEHPEPAGVQTRPAAPTGDSGAAPVSRVPTPADVARPEVAPAAPTRPDPVAAMAAPITPPPSPEPSPPVTTRPVTTPPESQPAAPATGEPAPAQSTDAQSTRAEPISAEATRVEAAPAPSGEDAGPPLVFPEVPTPEERERREQERRELEALLRAGNNDIPVRLPRKPRPAGAAPRAREPEPEEVRPAPPIPADVSQNILARLNRFAELEAQGEVEASPLGFGELLNWRDHHPERNVNPETGPATGPDAAPVPAGVQAAGVQAAVPAPDLPGAPRLRARASRSGRTGRDRGAEADTDEEPDRERPARTVPDTPPAPATNPAPTGESSDLTTDRVPGRATGRPDTPEPAARPEPAAGRVPVTREADAGDGSVGPRSPVEGTATPFDPSSARRTAADPGRETGNPAPFRPIHETDGIRTGTPGLPDPAVRPEPDHRSEDRFQAGPPTRPDPPPG